MQEVATPLGPDSSNMNARSLSLVDVSPSVRRQWLELVDSSSADLSMAPEWFESTARARAVEHESRVFVLQDGPTLTAVAPYIVRSHRILRVLATRSRELPGSYLVAYHPEIVTAIAAEEVLEKLVQDCAGSSDVLVLPNVEVHGRTASAARSVARKLGLLLLTVPGHSSPYITVDAGWDDFLQSRPRKFRYKLRTELKHLEAAGAVVNRWFGDSKDVDDLLDDMLCIEENSWKVGADMAITNSAMERSYYRSLLPFLAARQSLHANILYLESQPIAYSLCYATKGRISQLKTSFDQRFSRLGAGSVAQRFSIQHAFEVGAREYDFLGDAMPHKLQWGASIREHESLYLYLPGLRGFVAGATRKVAAALRRSRQKTGSLTVVGDA